MPDPRVPESQKAAMIAHIVKSIAEARDRFRTASPADAKKAASDLETLEFMHQRYMRDFGKSDNPMMDNG
jgi:hypothetical protein